MALEVRHRDCEGVVVLDLKGKLALGPGDAELRQLLQALLDAGKNKVVLNLRDVSVVDTAAVGSLTLWAQKFQSTGGRLVLLNVVPRHAELTDVLKLDTVIASYKEELEAVNSFFPDRAVPSYDLLEFLQKDAANKTA